MQDLVGGPAAFEPFMRHYLQTFAFKNVDSQQFKDIFCDFFKDKPASEPVSRRCHTAQHCPQCCS